MPNAILLNALNRNASDTVYLLTDAIRDAVLVGAGNACTNLPRSCRVSFQDLWETREVVAYLHRSQRKW